jgi:hypothetical protein
MPIKPGMLDFYHKQMPVARPLGEVTFRDPKSNHDLAAKGDKAFYLFSF